MFRLKDRAEKLVKRAKRNKWWVLGCTVLGVIVGAVALSFLTRVALGACILLGGCRRGILDVQLDAP